MTDPTTTLNAALEGRYVIERELGAGGMATVYLAADLKHERKVAVKVLKPELAAVVGAERFLAEIKTTANLQHPHILPLHDSGEADGFLFYVMPYVEGETLRGKIEREKQLSVKDALDIARKVASALDYAHGRGVVHRDIKPANVLLSQQGEPLVADFGIALAVAQAGGGRITETGLSLGTPHYMSPEQATGDREVDPRSDVYALGCVVFEMLAGQPPFTSSSAQATLVQILTADAPPVTRLRRTVPAHVEGVLARALEKLPADRFASAADFARALDDEGFRYVAAGVSGRSAGPMTGIPPGARPPLRAWLDDRRSVAAVLIGVAMTTLALWGLLRPRPVTEPGVTTRSALTGLDMNRPPSGGRRLAISPDGRWIVAGDSPDLYIRAADDLSWRRLTDAGEATSPTFSPDGTRVAFNGLDGRQILQVPVTGGTALPIAEGSSPHWGADETIVFGRGGNIYSVAPSGGNETLLYEASDSIQARRPHLLPGGRAVVFGTGALEESRIAVLDLDTEEVRILLDTGSNPTYVAPGYLVYGHRDLSLMGVPFDLESLTVTGTPVTLLPDLTILLGGASQYAVSANGTLVYDQAGDLGEGRSVRLAEVALDGTATPLPLEAGDLEDPRYSPDGRRIAYTDSRDLRLFDVLSGASPIVSNDEDGGRNAAWSNSGEHLFFRERGLGRRSFRWSDDGGGSLMELESAIGGTLLDFAPGDSVGVAYRNDGPVNPDLWVARIRGDSVVAEPFLTAGWDEANASLSPDGRWVAYQSDESGEDRVYVHSFPALTTRHDISPGLGGDPVWAPDGRRIYYRAGSEFYAVEVSTEPAFTAGAPTLLFEDPRLAVRSDLGWTRGWDVHPDGDRFVMVFDEGRTDTDEEVSGSARLTDVVLVTNWFEELKARMGN